MLNTLELAEDLHARTSQLVTRDQLDARFAEVDAKFSDLKAEVKTDIAVVRTEIANLRADMERTIRMQTVWLAGTMVAVAGLVVTLTKIL